MWTNVYIICHTLIMLHFSPASGADILVCHGPVLWQTRMPVSRPLFGNSTNENRYRKLVSGGLYSLTSAIAARRSKFLALDPQLSTLNQSPPSRCAKYRGGVLSIFGRHRGIHNVDSEGQAPAGSGTVTGGPAPLEHLNEVRGGGFCPTPGAKFSEYRPTATD